MADDNIETRMDSKYNSKMSCYIRLGHRDIEEEYQLIINSQKSFLEKAKDKFTKLGKTMTDKYDQICDKIVYPNDLDRKYNRSKRNLEKMVSQLKLVEEQIDEEIHGKEGLLEKIEETESAMKKTYATLKAMDSEVRAYEEPKSKSSAIKQELEQQNANRAKSNLEMDLNMYTQRFQEYENRIKSLSMIQKKVWEERSRGIMTLQKSGIPLERELVHREYQYLPKREC